MEKFGTDARFLSNNSVTCEANHVKFKTLVQGSLAHMKATLICRNRSKGSPMRGESLPTTGKFQFWELRAHPVN